MKPAPQPSKKDLANARKEVTKEGPAMDYTDKNLAFPKPSGKKKKKGKR